MGNDAFAALLKDRMHAGDFIAFLRQTAQRHPAVYFEVVKALGPSRAARWGLRLARSALAS